MTDGPTHPQAPAPAPRVPPDSPERRVRRIVQAVLFEGLDADGAADRLRPVLDGAATDGARARLERDFRAVMAAAARPRIPSSRPRLR